MDLHRYLRAIRNGWWILVIGVLVGGLGAFLWSKHQSPVYAASVDFYVSTPGLTDQNALSSDQFAQDRATSYAQLASKQNLADLVSHDTGLPRSEVIGKITGEAQLNTILFTTTVKDTSRARGLQIARSVAKEMPILTGRLDNSGTTGVQVAVKVVSGPTSSPTPVSPRTQLNTVIGALAGLLIGLLLATLRELLDVSVDTPNDLAALTGVPVLGVIAHDSSARKAPLVVGTSAQSIRAEAFRQLRTNVSFADAARRLNVLMVTSSSEGEGKSTTVANLGLMCAETGMRVLLIDTDLRRPRLSHYLGLEKSVGLTNVILGQIDVEAAVQPWGDRGLALLASGPVPPNPSELLESKVMHDLLVELREQYDLIILDTPPVLPVTDAVVVSAYADGALVVFRSGKTRTAQVVSALDALHVVNARVIGCVLNMRARRRGSRSGYAQYYYGRAETRWYRPLRHRNDHELPRAEILPARQLGAGAARARGWVPETDLGFEPAASASARSTATDAGESRAAAAPPRASSPTEPPPNTSGGVDAAAVRYATADDVPTESEAPHGRYDTDSSLSDNVLVLADELWGISLAEDAWALAQSVSRKAPDVAAGPTAHEWAAGVLCTTAANAGFKVKAGQWVRTVDKIAALTGVSRDVAVARWTELGEDDWIQSA